MSCYNNYIAHLYYLVQTGRISHTRGLSPKSGGDRLMDSFSTSYYRNNGEKCLAFAYIFCLERLHNTHYYMMSGLRGLTNKEKVKIYILLP